MFRASHRTFRPLRARTPNRLAQIGTMAAERAIKTAYRCLADLEPKTSCHKGKGGNTTGRECVLPPHTTSADDTLHSSEFIRLIYVRESTLVTAQVSARAIFPAIDLNSVNGFSSLTRKMLRRAFITQSNFIEIASSSARLNLKLSRKSRLARLRSWALPMAFLVAVMPTRCLSPFAGKMKTVIKRPSKRFPCS